MLLFGWNVVGHLGGRSVGFGSDPAAFSWFVGWWPHALGSGTNPLRLDVVFAPGGVPAAWATSIPVLSLLGSPVTLISGPVEATNVLFLAAPALAAFGGFLLCREVTANYLAAFIGGWLYGFSAFVGAHMLGHLNLAFVVWVPLLGLIAMRVARGSTTRRRAIGAFGVLVALQLGTSTEITLQLTVFGLLVLGVIALLASAQRPALRQVVAAAIPGWLMGALIMSPLLIQQALAGRTDWHPARRADSQDLLAPVIPDPGLLFSLGAGLSDSFTSGLAERGAYLSIFGVALFVVLAWRARGTLAGRALPLLGLITFLFALGPLLHVAGRELPVPMPAAAFVFLPVFDLMITGRFGLFMALTLALAAAVAITDRHIRRWALPLALLTVVATLPDPTSSLRWSDASTPPALAAGATSPVYEQLVITLPPAMGMRWQAVGGYSYAQVGGYTGVILPPDYRSWQDVLDGFAGRGPLPTPERFTAYVETFGADVVVVGPGAPSGVAELLVTAGFVSQTEGGVEIWLQSS